VRRLAAAAAAGLIAGTASGGAASDCRDSGRDDEVLRGRLAVRDVTDAAGRRERAFILELPAVICLRGRDEMDLVDDARTIHVTATDAALRQGLAAAVGHPVTLRGHLSGAEAAQHHAPIVMELRAIEGR
jgi:hypothetical protein